MGFNSAFKGLSIDTEAPASKVALM